jgi:hypothetical protein
MSVKQYLEQRIRFIKEDDMEVKKDVEPSDNENPVENDPEIQDADIVDEPEEKPSLKIHNAEDVVNKIKLIMSSLFPKSYINARFKNNILPSIVVSFAIGKDNTEWKNGIINNDPFHEIWHIYGFDKSGNLEGDAQLDTDYAGGFRLKNNEYVKVPFRKKTGKIDNIIKHIQTYYHILKQSAIEHKDQLDELSKRKIS